MRVFKDVFSTEMSRNRFCGIVLSIVLLTLVIQSFFFSIRMQSASLPRTKSAIVYLLRYTARDMENLCYSMQKLYQNFVYEFQYPIIVLHDEDITEADKNRLHYYCARGSQVKFVRFSFPSIPSSAGNETLWIPKGFSLGYRHMCYFWTGPVFDLPEIAKLEYIMRLDTDSVILSRVKYDMFGYLKQNRKYFAFRNSLDPDPEFATMHFWDFLYGFTKMNNIAPRQQIPFPVDLKGPVPNYNNNFEMFHVPRFRREDYRGWVRAINDSGGVYKYRWGDADLIVC